MINKFIASQLIPDTSSIGIFNRTYYISGKVRKQIWWSVEQRIELCVYCLNNGCTGLPNYDSKSFIKWELRELADPIYVFEHNLKLKKCNQIDYSMILKYLTVLANKIAGTNGYDVAHILDMQYSNRRYSIESLSQLNFGRAYMDKLYSYR